MRGTAPPQIPRRFTPRNDRSSKPESPSHKLDLLLGIHSVVSLVIEFRQGPQMLTGPPERRPCLQTLAKGRG